METSKNKNGQGQGLLSITSPQKLFAWCAGLGNTVCVSDLETKQDYAQFNGVKLNNGNGIFDRNPNI